MLKLTETLYFSDKKLFFWCFFASDVFHSFFVFFEISFFTSLSVVFIKPYFEKHEKTMKNYEKKHVLLKDYKLSAIICEYICTYDVENFFQNF